MSAIELIGLDFGFSNTTGRPPSDNLLERLIRLYEVTSRSYRQPDGSMWGVIDRMKLEIHQALIAPDRPALRRMLADPATTDLYYGMDTLSKNAAVGLANGSLQSLIAQYVCKTLVMVGEVSGARRFWNFEAKPEREPLEAEALLSDLSSALGWPVDFPNPFPGEYGLVTSRGVIGHRAPYALYHAVKVKELLAVSGGNRILEIGAGVGRTAYSARRMGLGAYTIVDLPMSLVGQAAFLAACLGEDAIWLEGEEHNQNGCIRLVSPPALLAGDDRYDVAINIDSMTEMPESQSLGYFSWLQRNAGMLYAMNHELNQHRTLDIAVRSGARPPVRFPSDLRPGYVEELYFFDDGRQLSAENAALKAQLAANELILRSRKALVTRAVRRTFGKTT